MEDEVVAYLNYLYVDLIFSGCAYSVRVSLWLLLSDYTESWRSSRKRRASEGNPYNKDGV